MTELAVTVEGLSSTVEGYDGKLTQIIQTVNGLTLSASNGSTQSTITISSQGITLTSAVVTFTGIVTFYNLKTQGETVINGDNITTGTITGRTLRSVSSSDNGFELYYTAVSPSLQVGGIKFDDQGAGTAEESRYRMFIYTNQGYQDWAMKLQSGGNMSLVANGGMLYLHAPDTIMLSTGGETMIYRGKVRTGGGRTYTFEEDGIYLNGTKITS